MKNSATTTATEENMGHTRTIHKKGDKNEQLRMNLARERAREREEGKVTR